MYHLLYVQELSISLTACISFCVRTKGWTAVFIEQTMCFLWGRKKAMKHWWGLNERFSRHLLSPTCLSAPVLYWQSVSWLALEISRALAPSSFSSSRSVAFGCCESLLPAPPPCPPLVRKYEWLSWKRQTASRRAPGIKQPVVKTLLRKLHRWRRHHHHHHHHQHHHHLSTLCSTSGNKGKFRGVTIHRQLVLYLPITVARRSKASLRPIACWDCGFESRRGHGRVSVVSVLCCQVEVSATGWSLFQRSPTDCSVSLCVI